MEPSASVALLLLRSSLELSEKDEDADDEFEEDDDRHFAGECRLMALENDLLCCAVSSSIAVVFLSFSWDLADLRKSDLR